MSDIETLKAEVKKLSSRATTMKMNLHDLAEDLPVNWQTIMDVAAETHTTFETLEAKRAELKALEAKAA
ncbi:CCE_0567 family metalloprotein [Acuticoccus sediminis]|uniref:CCE_0567 family metalloprotein n=1 Tax=Acuticoccus sediminis TaxID=2184697 RepID=UPI001CFF2867|nr:CCE_0567 family metalloprotein [Acuticoccus sediminis]